VTDPKSSPELKVSREALHLVHHHPGRLRVRADLFRVDPGSESMTAVERVQRGVERFAGVTRCEHNARTGSLLIEYQPGVAQAEDILAYIADTAGLDRYSPDRETGPRDPGLIAIDAVREMNEIAHELTGQRMDLRTMVPAGMIGMAAYAFAQQKGERMPRWEYLLFWGYQLFATFHRPEIEGGAPTQGAPRSFRP